MCFEAYARFHNSRESNICGLLLFTSMGKSPPNLGQTPILMMYCTDALSFCDSFIVQYNTLTLHAKTFSQKTKMLKLAWFQVCRFKQDFFMSIPEAFNLEEKRCCTIKSKVLLELDLVV